MLSAHVHVFEDELLPQKQPLENMSGKLQLGKGRNATSKQPMARAAVKSVEGVAQTVKPKRRCGCRFAPLLLKTHCDQSTWEPAAQVTSHCSIEYDVLTCVNTLDISGV